MNNFKVKSCKKKETKISKENSTIDKKHNDMIQTFAKNRKSIQRLEKQIASLTTELDSWDMSKKQKQIDTFIALQDQKIQAVKQLEKLQSSLNEEEYLLDTGKLLFQYYEIKNNKVTKSFSEKESESNPNQKKTILSFFTNSKEINKSSEETSSIHRSSEIRQLQKDTVSKEIHEDKYNHLNKQTIMELYLSKINQTPRVQTKQYITQNEYYCEHCQKEMIIYRSNGVIICPQCGIQKSIILDSDKPSYKEPPKEISYFAYKRINHFNEWLAQFQAKETTDIPGKVYDLILIEIKKERIHNVALLTNDKLRQILKKLKLNRYYEHIPHIMNRINGIQAPTISRELEEKLRAMFRDIQTPFMKHVDRKKRRNFLSYSYVLHKFVQLLGYDEYIDSFPLLKSREKLHQQDLIWKKICDELNWEFIKSL